MTFYTTWICLFMCPQHGHGMRGNIDCWVSGERKERKNGSPQNEKGGGGTDVALVEHKNNGAISVSCWRNLNEQPITQVCVGLLQGAWGAKWSLFWCYTSLCTQPMSNFTDGDCTVTEAVRQWSLSFFFLFLPRRLPVHPSRTSQRRVFIRRNREKRGRGGLQITDNGTELMKRMEKCH